MSRFAQLLFQEVLRLNQAAGRDGLQGVRTIIPTEIKKEFLKKLAKAQGQNPGEVEATSFVSATAIPQFADSKDLSEMIRTDQTLSQFPRFSALALNPKGVLTTAEQGFKTVGCVISPSATFTQKNMGTTPEQMEQRLKEMWEIAREKDLDLRLYLSMCFYDPFTREDISPQVVADLMLKASEMGIKRLVISDTTGHGTPQQTKTIIEECFRRGIPVENMEVHFHDTYGSGIANSLAAIDMGIISVDSSAGGIGGCPFAPGASGNIATEDLVWALERSGVRTGISMEKLMEATTYIFESCFPNQKPTSRVYNALMSKSPEERSKAFRDLQPYLYETEKSSPQPQTQPLVTKRLATETQTLQAGHN